MGGKKWSEAEIMTMRAHFPMLGYNIAALMQRRTHEAVRAKAKEMGIKTPEQAKREAMNARLRDELAEKLKQQRPEYPPQYTRTTTVTRSNKEECAPCGKVRRWVREWTGAVIIAAVWTIAIVLIVFKAFGG